MQQTASAQLLDQQEQLLNFMGSETEKIHMVIAPEEIGLIEFTRSYLSAAVEKGNILVFQYTIWPREHSRHFLYRWMADTVSGEACRSGRIWTDCLQANPGLQRQLEVLKTKDPRPIEVRFLETVRFIAEKIDPGQTLLLNIMPLTVVSDPTLVDFFKSILQLLPSKTKMIIGQCEGDVLSGQRDFCPSNRIILNGVGADATQAVLARYYQCYHDDGTNGLLMRTLVYLAHPIGIHDLSALTGIDEAEIGSAVADEVLASMLAGDDPTRLRLAYPRLLFPQEATIRQALAEDMANVNHNAVVYFQEQLDRLPDSRVALDHSLAICRLGDATIMADQALSTYRRKIELGAGEMSEVELQRALEGLDKDDNGVCGRLYLALAEVQEHMGRNRSALDALEKAIERLQKTNRRVDLQLAFELKGRAAFGLRHIDVAQAAFDNALRLARELEDPALIADILSQYGYLHFSIRQLDAAVTMYQEALESHRRLFALHAETGRRGMAAQLSNLGHVAYARSDFEQAESFHRQALGTYTELADKDSMAGQWGYLGHTYFAAREYDKAIHAYEQAAAHDEQAGNPMMAAQRYANMGHTMYARREPEKAQHFFVTALKRYKAQGNASGEAAQYSNLGLVKGDQGEFDHAVDYFEQARRIYEDLGDAINAVTQIIRLGHVRRGQNDLNAAKAHYEDAMQRYHDLNYSLGEGDIALELGQVNASLEEWEAADRHFKRAKEIYASLSHKEKEGMCLLLSAQVCHTRGDATTALSILTDAAALYKKIDNPLGVANTAFQIGLLHFDQQRCDEAENHYRQALDIFRKKADQEGVANVLANLGTLHFQARAFNQAAEELDEALALLRQLQHPVGLAGVLTNLSYVHEARQHYSAAYDCLKEARDLYRKIKADQEADQIDRRLEEIERQADLSLMRMRGSINSMTIKRMSP